MKTFILKLKKRHPAGKMRIGKHVVTNKPQSFELDKKEQEELKSKGCQHWFEIKETGKEEKPAPKEK